MNMILGYFLGLAVAACFAGPADTVLFLIGGIAGALPAVLDGTFARHMVRPDVDIIPDPLNPDPASVAGAIADNVNASFIEDKPVLIRLRSARLAEDISQRYEISFNVARREVNVSFGDERESGAGHLYNIQLDAASRMKIEDGDGLVLSFSKDGGMVRVSSEPHRYTWSHSLVTGFLLSLVSAAVLGLTAGLIVILAWGLHLALDLLCSRDIALWFPFSRRRIRGRRRISRKSDIVSHS